MLCTQLIMDHIRSHPILATISVGAGTVFVSEVVWKVVKYFLGLRKKQLVVNEVLVFNELGEICAAQHLRNSIPGSGPMVTQCRNEHCSQRNLEKIVEQIDRAVYSIDVAIYTFTSIFLAEAFKRALQRGVNLRIITDREMCYSSGSQINELARLGVPVRAPDSTKMMHNKYCVIDGAERVEEIRLLKQRKWMRPFCSVIITGSVNWTRQGFGGNWENCIISADEEFAGKFQADFSRMWKAFKKTENKLIPSE
ncbi:mitochondrial cardiolipin hydrolase [Drosophila ficusphila]|uniref:mitochondrial cardiolipin hydrolase n=1 Tax=Drosophila ficusphila TaxID=30025 RepID=UPI0007E70686|nr:mitochondrial cardiolipin hydrolase [Drosophila ficusphila]